jgi:hypothetical protein
MNDRIARRQPCDPMFGRSDVAGDRCHADVIEPYRRRAGPRQAEQLMAAPDQLAHHSCADPAGPTENKDAQRQPLSVEARPPPDIALTRTERSLRTNIAVQRRERKKVSNKNRRRKFLLNLFRSDRTAQRALLSLTGCATILRSYPPTRLNSSLETSKIK